MACGTTVEELQELQGLHTCAGAAQELQELQELQADVCRQVCRCGGDSRS